jgi:hypothetical protein
MSAAPPQLARFRSIATALDARWQIPWTPIRFGWDAIVGLVPGLGDALAGFAGSYGLYAGWRLGAPAVVLARMLLNLGLEVGLGSIPVAGDLFDIGFKGNLRNLRLLERWLDRPASVHRRSRWLLIALATSVFALLLGVVLLTLWLLHLLLTRGG